MTVSQTTSSRQSGFTLVELAIVMIIIGLLIGGILKGQELIANAQVTNAVTQIKGLDGAVSTFREAYNAFPGDMNNAATAGAITGRIVGCTAAPCTNGNGNGRLDSGVGAAPSLTEESVWFFNHLRAADMISGLDGSNTLAFGRAIPLASIGGGFSAGHTGGTGGVVGFTTTNMRSGHYIVLQGSATGAVTANPILTGNQAARIDRKLDDGVSITGTVHGVGATATGCASAAGAYAEATAGALCNIGVRIQG